MRTCKLRVAVLWLAIVAGCSPKPPPPSAIGPSAAPASGVPAATLSPAPSASPSAQAAAGPLRAISRGTRGEPARYIVRDRSGAIEYEVLSSTVVYDRAPDGAVAEFTNPRIAFHARSGRTVDADSPKAVAHDRDKNVVMTGGVRAKTDDGKTLTCSTLTYDARNQQILCEGDVVLRNTKTNQTASGHRLQTDPDFNHVVLSGG